MTRNDFIQQYVIASATTHFPHDAVGIAVDIADRVSKVAPFDQDMERIKCSTPDSQFFNPYELEVMEVDDIEKADISCVKNALRRANGDRRKAAEILNTTVRYLNSKIKKYNIDTNLSDAPSRKA